MEPAAGVELLRNVIGEAEGDEETAAFGVSLGEVEGEEVEEEGGDVEAGVEDMRCHGGDAESEPLDLRRLSRDSLAVGCCCC